MVLLFCCSYEPPLEVESLRLGAPVGPEMARREDAVDALVEARESWPLSEKKRRVDDERLGGAAKDATPGESGGELTPRYFWSLSSALSHSVHGCL